MTSRSSWVPPFGADGPSPWTRPVRAAVAAGIGPSADSISEMVGRSAMTLGTVGVAHQERTLTSDLLGLGRLGSLVADPAVTDLLVNGDGSVWVDRGAGTERTEVVLDPGATRPLAVRLAGLAGRRLDDAQPWVDGLLPQGIRLHAILPPLVVGGPHLSLRIPRVSPGSLADLEEAGSCSGAMAGLLRQIVQRRCSFLVVGGTGSGKTTLLGGLLAECDHRERIVLVEDVRELLPQHPHVIHLQGRAPNVEGSGQVTMTDLVRQGLRMRPDRLVVGEVRGGEVRELLAALNTGHRGSAGTVHANSAAEVPARLGALGALAGLSLEAVEAQVLSGVEFIVTMQREGVHRRVVEVGLIQRDPRGRVTVGGVLTRTTAGQDTPGVAWSMAQQMLQAPP